MKKNIIFCFVALMSFAPFVLKAQDDAHQTATKKNTTLKPREQYGKTDQVYKVVEKSATFPGGVAAMHQYLQKDLNISDSKTADQQRYFFSFIVEKDGMITNIELLRPKEVSVEQGIKVKQALTALSNMPNWIPGEQAGEKMATSYVLPITM
jgi:ABC-type phosphate/phosphonate transport system substrate-binding protein